MVLFRNLALQAKENHIGIGLKAFTFLLAFIGIVLSVLGSLTCQYLGYHNDDSIASSVSSEMTAFNTTSSSPRSAFLTDFLPLKGASEAWIGLFSFDIVKTTDTGSPTSDMSITTNMCSTYASLSVGDSPYMLLLLSQISSMVAPSLAILSILIFFIQFAQQCCCRCNYYTVSLMMLLTAGFQGCTMLLFLEPTFCGQDGGCKFGYGAWISVASTISFFLSSVLMGCNPGIDRWIEVAATSVPDTIGDKKGKSSSDDATNSVLTNPSYVSDPPSANLNAFRKAQQVWGNIFDIDEENQQKVQREIEQECNVFQDQCNTGQCGNEMAQELTKDLKKVFSTQEIQRDLEKAFSSLKECKKKSERNLSKKNQPQSRMQLLQQSRRGQGSQRISQPDSLQEPSSNGSYTTSYFNDTTTLQDTTTLTATSRTEATDEMTPPVNPIIARMQRGLTTKNTQNTQPNGPATEDWNWAKWS